MPIHRFHEYTEAFLDRRLRCKHQRLISYIHFRTDSGSITSKSWFHCLNQVAKDGKKWKNLKRCWNCSPCLIPHVFYIYDPIQKTTQKNLGEPQPLRCPRAFAWRVSHTPLKVAGLFGCPPLSLSSSVLVKSGDNAADAMPCHYVLEWLGNYVNILSNSYKYSCIKNSSLTVDWSEILLTS